MRELRLPSKWTIRTTANKNDKEKTHLYISHKQPFKRVFSAYFEIFASTELPRNELEFLLMTFFEMRSCVILSYVQFCVPLLKVSYGVSQI